MTLPYRFAVCNELFQRFPFAEACSHIRRLGYSGIELAPFTLAENPVALTAEDRSQVRQSMAQNNLAFVGLHWLLVSPAGLHATTPHNHLRRETWAFIGGLIDLCADLQGPSPERPGVLIFGSPKQRSATGGCSAKDATAFFTEELARIAPHAESRGARLLIEPLSPDQTDVVTTLDEAVAIVQQIASPAIQTMFDTHNAVKEILPHPELLRKYLPFIQHVHVNEMDGREPGTGHYDFAALLSTLATANYRGWVSLEAFDFSRDPSLVAGNALRHLTEAANSAVLTQT